MHFSISYAKNIIIKRKRNNNIRLDHPEIRRKFTENSSRATQIFWGNSAEYCRVERGAKYRSWKRIQNYSLVPFFFSFSFSQFFFSFLLFVFSFFFLGKCLRWSS
ncbi:hypothetical protein AAHE18_06G164500 [Arachis hypogaea]